MSMTTDGKTSFVGDAPVLAQRSTERGIGKSRPSDDGESAPMVGIQSGAAVAVPPIAGLPRIEQGTATAEPRVSASGSSPPRSVTQVPRPAPRVAEPEPPDLPESVAATSPLSNSDASRSGVSNFEIDGDASEIDDAQEAYPGELVNSEVSSTRVYLYAPNGIRVQLNSITEAPPPVQITCAPGPTRAIPYRFAAPLAIIVFAAGAMLVLLFARGNGRSANVEDANASTRPEPLQASRAEVAPLTAQRTEATEEPHRVAPSDAPREAPREAEVTSSKSEAATTAASALPVILMDIPADDPMVLRPPTRKSNPVGPGSKKTISSIPSSGKARPRFDKPD